MGRDRETRKVEQLPAIGVGSVEWSALSPGERWAEYRRVCAEVERYRSLASLQSREVARQSLRAERLAARLLGAGMDTE